MTATSKSYSWLKKISPELLQHDTIPLIGSPPAFPWEELSLNLSRFFQIENLKITPATSYEWKEGNKITEGLGDKVSPLFFTIAPTGGTLLWLMSEKDVNLLMTQLLKISSEMGTTVDQETREGFYQFLALEVINQLPFLPFDKEVSAHILENQEIPTSSALCLDVSISIKEFTCWGRLVISNELQQKWRERYAMRKQEVPFSTEIELEVGLQIGQTALEVKEWSQVHTGDFLLLRTCSVKPNGEGTVMLMLNETPLFKGELSQGSIKILESPLYREVGIEMSNQTPNDDMNEIEENGQNSSFEETENNNLENTEEEFEETSEEEDYVEGDELFEEDLEELPQEKWPPLPEKRPETVAQPAPTEEKKKPEPTKPMLSPEEIPISIAVEVGRIQMSVQKLMELQPGNTLDLNIHPESGVDLVVNGQCIAKGELLLVGDSLGVRILQLKGSNGQR